jgi:hypothetical protein
MLQKETNISWQLFSKQKKSKFLFTHIS